jgi:cytochrome c oxidase subunit 2
VNPSSISPTTQAVDSVFLYIFGISIFMLVGITAIMIYFVVKYDRKKYPKALPSPSYNIPLETAWTVIPTIIVLTMFWYGWQGYTTLANVPKDALLVKVTGRQWTWSFEYPNGKISDKLYVPVGRPIKLDMTSKDVIHSFYVPAFRIKKDVVPGMTTHEWFRAPTEGSYDAFCAEYCGVGHSQMITTVEAMSVDKFQEWYQQKEARAEVPRGEQLLTQYGCIGCHSLDGSKKVGPTLKGIFGRQVTVTTNGKEHVLTADAEYIKRSILNPNFDVVKGFQPIMPSFKGKMPEHDLEEIVEYLQEGTGAGGETRGGKGISGEELAKKKGCTGCHSTDGTKKVGPTWKGLYDEEVTVSTDGEERTVQVDADYLKRSITHPGADIVKGFPPVMPAYSDLSEKELDALVEYIRSLK